MLQDCDFIEIKCQIDIMDQLLRCIGGKIYQNEGLNTSKKVFKMPTTNYRNDKLTKMPL